tara:strand:+ start:224 stop:409 length:186 start_codon:yes stop_codon:yes gene_type:complete
VFPDLLVFHLAIYWDVIVSGSPRNVQVSFEVSQGAREVPQVIGQQAAVAKINGARGFNGEE